MKKLCIVQARMGSSRLPGKVLKMINGYPMIYYTLTRLKESKYIDEIVVATSTKDIDIPLVKYVEYLGIKVFRGSESNVLERYKLASDKYNGDVIIRVTGDCPLIDPLVVDNAITKYLIYGYDYLRLDVPNTFMRGFDVEVFSKSTLDKVYKMVCSDKGMNQKEYADFKEHVTYYIYTHKNMFNIGYLIGDVDKCKDINLSVDRKEDFELVKIIYEHFQQKYVKMTDILNYLKSKNISEKFDI